MKKALDGATGKDSKIVAVAAKDLSAHFGGMVPAPYADELVEMMTACLPEGLIAPEMESEQGIVRGKTDFVEVLHNIVSGTVERSTNGAF